MIISPDIMLFSVGDVADATIGFDNRIPSGSTISSATATEQTTSDLTLSSVGPNAATVDIDEEGLTTTVGIGRAVQFTVSGGTAANSPYVVLFALTLSDGQTVNYGQQMDFC